MPCLEDVDDKNLKLKPSHATRSMATCRSWNHADSSESGDKESLPIENIGDIHVMLVIMMKYWQFGYPSKKSGWRSVLLLFRTFCRDDGSFASLLFCEKAPALRRSRLVLRRKH